MLNPRIKLRHLQAFLEVARQRSFARAADTLAITQPAMSKTIRELEDAVAAALFERGPRGVTLTPSGMALLRHAGPAINLLQEGLAAVRQPASGEAAVRVGALSTVEEGLLPRAAQALHALFPEIRLQVHTGPSAYLLSQLGLGELDLVVGRMSEARESRGFSFEHLYHEPLVLVVRSGHSLVNLPRTRLSAEMLGEHPWVVPPAPTTLREQVERFWVEQGCPPPPIALETLSLGLSRRYVQRSEALWVAPLDAVRSELAEGSLVRLPVDIEAHGGSVGLCINATRALSPATERLIEQMRNLSCKRDP
ncbi:pca operon transcription factor PcaQ [Halomonas sp. HP20-15]|uniref:pca operon transcription factor PcaQ n=1 Tax=Halomonas sp. HP20-15 TaxID=3085901 RepID=UPI0029811DB2|nr:pca operon transcription factor PcaQ [Halomonas sp. HP20-15]MDW5377627.1 pca operon transcription factor PcaQ [Halomonas sp. HP20-15]